MHNIRRFLLDAFLVVAWVVLCLTSSADAQITASGVFPVGSVQGSVESIATTPSAGAAVMISASTGSSLTCSAYPEVTFTDTPHAGSPQTRGTITPH